LFSVTIDYSGLPVPQTPDAVIFTKTLSPSSWSGLVVVDCLGKPFSWPLKTVKVGMLLVAEAVLVEEKRWMDDGDDF
jgi:hypothetical protein